MGLSDYVGTSDCTITEYLITCHTPPVAWYHWNSPRCNCILKVHPYLVMETQIISYTTQCRGQHPCHAWIDTFVADNHIFPSSFTVFYFTRITTDMLWPAFHYTIISVQINRTYHQRGPVSQSKVKISRSCCGSGSSRSYTYWFASIAQTTFILATPPTCTWCVATFTSWEGHTEMAKPE